MIATAGIHTPTKVCRALPATRRRALQLMGLLGLGGRELGRAAGCDFDFQRSGGGLFGGLTHWAGPRLACFGDQAEVLAAT